MMTAAVLIPSGSLAIARTRRARLASELSIRYFFPFFDSDWLPSSLYGNAGSSTMCFSFVDVYLFRVIPVITGGG